MVVGQENVGKTTLIRSLNKKKVKKISKSPTSLGLPNMSTDGIDIEDWSIEVTFKDKDKDAKPRKQNVTFSVWDFAGQGIFLYFL
jgi:GTPase SAR1 family protein